jgi:hypothetical protein
MEASANEIDGTHGAAMRRLRPYLRRELVYVALGAMDTCVTAPLYAALLAPVVDLEVWSLFAGLLLGILVIHYVARLSFQVPISSEARSILIAAGIVLSGAAAVQRFVYPGGGLWSDWIVRLYQQVRQDLFGPEMLIFLLAAFLWWRGLVLAQRRLDSSSVAFRFRLGVLLMVVTTGIAGSAAPWPYQRLVFLFFFVSLLGIALARADEIGQQYGGRETPFGLGWLVTLIAVSGVVLAAAAGLTAVLTGRTLGRVLLPVLRVLQVAVFALVYVLAWLAQFILQPLLTLLERYEVGRALADIFDELSFPDYAPEPGEPSEPFFAPGQMEVIRLAVAVLGALIVLFLVAVSLSRLRAKSKGSTETTHESVWEGLQLRSILDGMRDTSRRGLKGLGDALAGSRVAELFAARTIRRTYAHMAALAARRGHPRSVDETPYDYLETLQSAFPENQRDAALITESYVLVHYGELPESRRDLARVRAAWSRIQRRYRGRIEASG